jgi:ABC-2 type transport system permease protein
MIFLFPWSKRQTILGIMMRNFWLVAKKEYLMRVKVRSFLLGILVVPGIFILIIGGTIIISNQQVSDLPFGYVDYSGLLSGNIVQADDGLVPIIKYPDEIAAKEALEAEDIQGYHVIAQNYLETLEVDLYYLDERPDTEVLIAFDDYVRAHLLPSGPTKEQTRLIEGSELILRSSDGSREFRAGAGFLTLLFPLIVSVFFIFSVMGSAGYFLQAVTDEKESRTMEIIITSVSPNELILGKSLGLMGVALTQLGVWIATLILGWIIARCFIEDLQGIQLPWEIFLFFPLFFIPSFGLIAGVMTAIGGVVTELQEVQQISGLLNLSFTFPLFLTAIAFATPDNPLLIFLSFWPTTSFITILLRWGLTIIPIWQLALSWIILVLTTCLVFWSAVKIFRMGMLRYGQKMSLKNALSALQDKVR